MIDAQIQKRQGDGSIFSLYFSVLLVDKKPLVMPPDGRAKLAHKFIELMQAIKPIETVILRELGTLADAAPQMEVQEMMEEKGGKDKKKNRRTFAPGSLQTEPKEEEKGDKSGRKRKGSN